MPPTPSASKWPPPAWAGLFLPAFGGYMAQRISLETIPAMLVFTILAMLLLYLFSTRFKSTAETL